MVIEQDAIGSHASGFAYGGLGSLGGAGIPGPASPIAVEGMNLHRQLSDVLREETGINTGYRLRPSLSLFFTDKEIEESRRNLSWKQQQSGYNVRLVDAREAHSIECRISSEVVGGLYVEGNAEVDSYKFVLAMAQAAENLGATIRHGRVTGLKSKGRRVEQVVLENDLIQCGHTVLAMGPWSAEASNWVGKPIHVSPLKGQILRLRAQGPSFQISLGWGGGYATTKPDGLLWTGTTEEDVGFDERPTPLARDQIMAQLLKMVPSLSGAQLVTQTACLRPLSADRLLVLGKISGQDRVYIATGGGRQGILLGPAVGRIISDLVTTGSSSIPIGAFSPDRFESDSAG